MNQSKLIKCLFSLLLTSTTTIACANTVDGLRTDKDVLKFVSKLHNLFKIGKVPQISIISTDSLITKVDFKTVGKQLGIKTWEKADFNDDCRTDLLVTVMWNVNHTLTLFVLIDNGNDTYKIINLVKTSLYGYQMAKPTIIKQKQLLVYCSKDYVYNQSGRDKGICRLDTLIYKYGNFVEFNPKPDTNNISSIYLETGGCLGNCPAFSLAVSINGAATYNAIAFNPRKGIFKECIDAKRLSEIFKLANYLKINQLKDKYRVGWTDDQTIKLKIKFKNGCVKNITDYGARGTFGLYYLYDLLFKLRLSETWR
jgi:predicted small secreted protein